MQERSSAAWFRWSWPVLPVVLAASVLLSGADAPADGGHAGAAPVGASALPASAPHPSPEAAHAPAAEEPAARKSAEGAPSALGALGSTEVSLRSSEVVRALAPKLVDEARMASQRRLDAGRRMREDKDIPRAVQEFSALLEAADTPEEIRRTALIELALCAQQGGELLKALQVFSQFVQTYPEDPSVPELLLRQGLIYRDVGAHTNALNKFFGVLSSSLAVKFERMDYYQRLVLQAQAEIAETYFLQGKYSDACYNYSRLLRLDAPDLDKARLRYKNIQCLALLDRYADVVGQAEDFLRHHPGNPEEAEVRYQLATALKRSGRNQEAMRQVLELLASQQTNAVAKPESWAYWQQRTGNDIANQLYKEGDYSNALAVYQQLAAVDPAAAWQMPALYQVGLVFERLRQPGKAVETYNAILARESEISTNTASPNLAMLLDMAKWRKNYLAWQTQAETTARSLASEPLGTNSAAIPR